ncbi:hypothetical protein LCGC14_2323220 [marine sediment metagenome]|uniref:Uncharacterized protein n=1 Tax=marine sediment metagenome TaxID=412755 RepID=A0A0F9EUL0_9ZZZZ
METKDWTPTIRVHALASKVLVVASTRIEGTWAAYCDAVPGDNHEVESIAVLENGGKLMEEVARVLFPIFEELPYAH